MKASGKADTDVTVYGFNPREAPREAADLARATYEAVVAIGRMQPDLDVAFVDLRSDAAKPIIQRLREQVGRALGESDVPIVEVGDILHAGFDAGAVASSIATSLATGAAGLPCGFSARRLPAAP